jgi:hypothetical protein
LRISFKLSSKDSRRRRLLPVSSLPLPKTEPKDFGQAASAGQHELS